MEARKATSLLALSLALALGGCSANEPQNADTGFNEGTLSSSTTPEEDTAPPPSTGVTSGVEGPERVSLRVESGGARYSGICTADGEEYVVSGDSSRSYPFEDRPFSCRIEKQDTGDGSLKVTVISGDSARSVQQTNAAGGTIEVSYDGS